MARMRRSSASLSRRSAVSDGLGTIVRVRLLFWGVIDYFTVNLLWQWQM